MAYACCCNRDNQENAEEWVCLEPPPPPPKHQHYFQAEALPPRCGPCSLPVGDTEPVRVCAADDRYPAHPYAPPPPTADACYERLPITRPAPRRHPPVVPAIDYFPQRTLADRPPPICCPRDLHPDKLAAMCAEQVGLGTDAGAGLSAQKMEPAGCGSQPACVQPQPPPQMCPPYAAGDAQAGCQPSPQGGGARQGGGGGGGGGGVREGETCAHRAAPCVAVPPGPCPPPCFPPTPGPPPCLPPRPPPVPCSPPNSCERLISEGACPRRAGCPWPFEDFPPCPCPSTAGLPGPPCFLPWEHKEKQNDDPNAPDYARKLVDSFNKMKYSDCDWRERYREVLRHFAEVHHASDCIDASAKRCVEGHAGGADAMQARATRALRERDEQIKAWLCRLERALVAMAEEQNLLQQQRHRVRTAMGILQMPQDIATECLRLRLGRMDCDNQRDEVEAELIKEANLMIECQGRMEDLLKKIEAQINSNRHIKDRCEIDWSDKTIAHEIESANLCLTNNSKHILLRPGATRIPSDQASLETWDKGTREDIELLEEELEKSTTLRSTVEGLLTDMIREMRTQADKVESLLENSIAEMDTCRCKLENELQALLRRVAQSEDVVERLREVVRNMDAPMKKAQTRLCNRHMRPRKENCRDPAQDALLEEVAALGQNVAALKGMLYQAEENLRCLMHQRHVMEREIQVKRNTLFINKERLRAVRAHYPSASALSGAGSAQ